MEKDIILIYTDFIKLEAALKLGNCVATGGEAKAYIQEGKVKVEGEVCLMRGKKLYSGDSFQFMGKTYTISKYES